MTRVRNHTFDSSNTRIKVARMLEALETPMTYQELAAQLHMSARSVHLYVNHLRNNPRRARVCAYRLVGGRWQKVIGLGEKADVPMPKKQTEQKRNAIFRAKVRADPERRLAQTLHAKARWAEKKAKSKPVTWISALM